MVRTHVELEIRDSHFKARNQDQDRPAIGAPSQGKAKGKRQRKCQTYFRERRLHPLDNKRANVHLEKHARSSMTRTRKAKGRDDHVHFLRQVQPHQKSKGDGKSSDDGSAKGTPTITGKSSPKKANRPPCTNFKKGSMQIRRQVCKKTKHNLVMKGQFQEKRKIPSDDKTQHRVRLHHFAEITFSKGNLGPTLGVIQTGSQNKRNPNSPTFEERCIEWTLSMEENSRKTASLVHKTCTRFQVQRVLVEKDSSSQVPRATFLHLLLLR